MSPAPAPSFASLGVPESVIAVLAAAGVRSPTPVQAAVLPDALAGRDVLARARTGSGKTLAFGVPLLTRLAGARSRIHRPRAVVVVPTRELAAQVHAALDAPASALRLRLVTVTGGTGVDRQVARIRQGSDVLVATPGRLRDLLDRRLVRADDVQALVLDEADQLCDLGFLPEVDALLGRMPPGQRLLLSATLDGDVDGLVSRHLHDPARLEVDAAVVDVERTEHHVIVVSSPRARVGAAVALVRANPRAVLFTRTREGAVALCAALQDEGLPAVDLHGDLPQHVRTRNLARFADRSARAVVATDVAARGLHVEGVGLVVHVDPPSDEKVYLHRSGRTARAGESGAVVTLATTEQLRRLLALQQRAGVLARRHELRSAPRPLTVAALAAAGS